MNTDETSVYVHMIQEPSMEMLPFFHDFLAGQPTEN